MNELFCKLPLSAYEGTSITLLYKIDMKGQSGHFDAVMSTVEEQERMWNFCPDANAVLLKTENYLHLRKSQSDSEQNLSFPDVLSNAIPSCNFLPSTSASSVQSAAARSASADLDSCLTAGNVETENHGSKNNSAEVYRGVKIADAKKFSWLTDKIR